MDALDIFNYFFVFLFSTIAVHAVPPEVCFANFRGDDCGHPPTPVIYYMKRESRCEVGIWRGCLPNINMFHDEYECIDTCIFVARAQPEDYHDHFKIPEEYAEIANMTIEIEANVTANSNDTQFQNETVTTTGAAADRDSAGDASGNGTDTGGANGTNSETTVGGDAAEGGETTADGGAPADPPES